MNKTEKAVAAYCDMMIKKMETLATDWRKPWFDGSCAGMPVNGEMREYNGINIFWLWITCETRGWQMPVFMTYNRIKQTGAHVLKGETSTPVFFWRLIAKNDNGKYVDAKDAQDGAKVFPVLKTFDVFNVEQTSIKKDAPEVWEKLKKRIPIEDAPVHDGGQYVCEDIDTLAAGGWFCPVHIGKSSRAYYSPSRDCINVPTKEQYFGDFNESGMQYYSTLLHEMAHSTGHASRLNRTMNTDQNSEDYAREELVAELTAAVIGHGYGFNTHVQEQNAAYLKGWLGCIKREPKYLLKVMGDVAKAVNMIQSKINS